MADAAPMIQNGDLVLLGAGDLDVRMKLLARWIYKSYADPWSHEFVSQLVRDLPPKNESAEIERVFRALSWPKVRYTYHPRGKDRYCTLHRVVELGTGDCLPVGTLVFRSDGQLVPVEQIRRGDVIAGDGCWTTVLAAKAKGIKPIRRFNLNNGGALRCTLDHRVFAVPGRHENGRRASLRARPTLPQGQREWAEEIRAGDIRPGQALLSPASIPAGTNSLSPDLAWLLGTFVADGCLQSGRYVHIAGSDPDTRKSIAGDKDKSGQKLRAAKIAGEHGVKSRVGLKSVLLHSQEWHDWLASCGHGARNKRLPAVDFDAASAAAVMEGLEADAWLTPHGAVVHVTASPLLALQLRVLWRMLGRSTGIHWQHYDNPAWAPTAKVVAWNSEAAGGGRIKPFPRVLTIEDEPASVETFDLETDTHRFWLPESDTVVHNCDNMVVAMATCFDLLGYQTGARIYSWTGESWDHIALLLGVPRNQPTSHLVLDATIGTDGTPQTAQPGLMIPWHLVKNWRDFEFALG